MAAERQRMQEAQNMPQGAPPISSSPMPDTAAQAEARRAAERAAQAQTGANPNPSRKRRGIISVNDFPALQAPALPISADQQRRLDDLLRLYKADAITPEQYQAGRAKILAGQ